MSDSRAWSTNCRAGAHDRCPHWRAVGLGGLLRGGIESVLVVCRCGCHAGCPVAGRRAIGKDEWLRRCVCPGAEGGRAAEERAAALRRQHAAILADVDLGGGQSASQVEARIRNAYLAHGQPPPPGLRSWSRLLAAGTARRGTRTVRLVILGARAVGSAFRWARQPSGDAVAVNRGGIGKLFGGGATYLGLAALLGGAASATSGWRRGCLAAAALVAGLAGAWTLTWGTVVVGLIRAVSARASAAEDSGVSEGGQSPGH